MKKENYTVTNYIVLPIIYFWLGLFTADVAASQKEWVWIVPKGVTKINVLSTRGDDTILNTKFSVEEGQIFKLEIVE